jgi:hypothetical protein
MTVLNNWFSLNPRNADNELPNRCASEPMPHKPWIEGLSRPEKGEIFVATSALAPRRPLVRMSVPPRHRHDRMGRVAPPAVPNARSAGFPVPTPSSPRRKAAPTNVNARPQAVVIMPSVASLQVCALSPGSSRIHQIGPDKRKNRPNCLTLSHLRWTFRADRFDRFFTFPGNLIVLPNLQWALAQLQSVLAGKSTNPTRG